MLCYAADAFLGVGGTAVAPSEAEAHDSTLVVSDGLALQRGEEAVRCESLQVPVQCLEPHQRFWRLKALKLLLLSMAADF